MVIIHSYVSLPEGTTLLNYTALGALDLRNPIQRDSDSNPNRPHHWLISEGTKRSSRLSACAQHWMS